MEFQCTNPACTGLAIRIAYHPVYFILLKVGWLISHLTEPGIDRDLSVDHIYTMYYSQRYETLINGKAEMKRFLSYPAMSQKMPPIKLCMSERERVREGVQRGGGGEESERGDGSVEICAG